MTNTNTRGSAAQRRTRRAWLIETYRADVDAEVYLTLGGKRAPLRPVPRGTGEIACRCYRCGELLIDATMTVDRIHPQAYGGIYHRQNIRPSCSPCATITGNELKAALREARSK